MTCYCHYCDYAFDADIANCCPICGADGEWLDALTDADLALEPEMQEGE